MRHLPTIVVGAILVASAGAVVISPETLPSGPESRREVGAPGPAPEATAPSPVLLLIDIHGPASVQENAKGRYTLVARYSDGTSLDVTDRAEWSVDSARAAVSRGILTAFEVRRNEKVEMTAWFTDGLSLKASRALTIVSQPESSGFVDVPPGSPDRGALRSRPARSGG